MENVTPVGTVSLGSIQLDIDPSDYTPLQARKRGSVHRLLNGGTVFQDRGVSAGDYVITLSGQLVNLETVQDLWTLYLAGGTFTLTDWLGNNFTVLFTPGVESCVLTPVHGSTTWTYKIQLSVTATTSILP